MQVHYGSSLARPAGVNKATCRFVIVAVLYCLIRRISMSTKVVTEKDNFEAMQDYIYQREMLYGLRGESNQSICATQRILRYWLQ